MSQKLLFLGIDTSTREALNYAKSLGVITIVTDGRPFESSPVKKLADIVWQIDVGSLNELEKRCQEEKIDGIFAGNHEFCLDMAKELTKRLNLPFYASDEGWACARDKARFKEHCMAVGLDVPKRYFVKQPFTEEMLAGITYPVIVKPTDACAQRGLSLCRNEVELRAAYEKALKYSQSKDIIVEDFIEGDEIGIDYFFINGEAVCFQVNDMLYTCTMNGRPIFNIMGMQSKYKDQYLQDTESKTTALFQQMECHSGAGFLQAIYRDGKYYILEFGYRIDGAGSGTVTKRRYGFSKVEKMVDLALGRDLSAEYSKIKHPENNGVSAFYFPMVKKGTIDKIIGLDEICSIDGVTVTLERFREGDEVKVFENMYQFAYYIGIWAENMDALIGKLMQINQVLKLCDKEGNNLLIPFEDYSAFLERQRW